MHRRQVCTSSSSSSTAFRGFCGDADGLVEGIVAIALEASYRLNAADVQAAYAQATETAHRSGALADRELEAVAGGQSGTADGLASDLSAYLQADAPPRAY